MRSIVLALLASVVSVGCAAQSDEPAYNNQLGYTEMNIVDAGTLGVAAGTIVVDSNDVVRAVHVDLLNGVNVEMGLEPDDAGATDWILTWLYAGEWHTVKVPGHVDVTLAAGCATLWVNSDALSGSATFCAD